MCSIGVIFMCFCAIFQSEAHLRIVVPQQNGIYVPPYAGVAQNGDGPTAGGPPTPTPPSTGPGTGGGTGPGTGGGTGPGAAEDYQCVPVGTCPYNGGNGGDDIDIRIVTPGQLCPTGQIPCYYPCGIRKINVTNGGDGIAENGAYPWQAYLEVGGGYVGSGVLLDRYHVLTAAHKVYQSRFNPGNVRVVMGVWNPANMINTQSSVATRIVVHEAYTETPKLLKDDIAVIRLATPIDVITQFNVGTGCLPTAGQAFPAGNRCLVAGWGETGFKVNDAPTNPQKQVTVPIVDVSDCRGRLSDPAVLGTNVDKYLDQAGGEICAGGEALKDACTLDGGAPLMCINAAGRYDIAGLVIWGKGCGRPGIPGVYVSVPFYAAWITNAIAQSIAASG